MRLGISAREHIPEHRMVLDHLEQQPNKSYEAMRLMSEALKSEGSVEQELSEIRMMLVEIRRLLRSGRFVQPGPNGSEPAEPQGSVDAAKTALKAAPWTQ